MKTAACVTKSKAIPYRESNEGAAWSHVGKDVCILGAPRLHRTALAYSKKTRVRWEREVANDSRRDIYVRLIVIHSRTHRSYVNFDEPIVIQNETQLHFFSGILFFVNKSSIAVNVNNVFDGSKILCSHEIGSRNGCRFSRLCKASIENEGLQYEDRSRKS